MQDPQDTEPALVKAMPTSSETRFPKLITGCECLAHVAPDSSLAALWVRSWRGSAGSGPFAMVSTALELCPVHGPEVKPGPALNFINQTGHMTPLDARRLCVQRQRKPFAPRGEAIKHLPGMRVASLAAKHKSWKLTASQGVDTPGLQRKCGKFRLVSRHPWACM